MVVFDKPFRYINTVVNGKIQENVLKAEDKHVGSIIGFSTQKDEQVIARVASSFISYEQAWQNLTEVLEKDFETVKSEGRNEWNDVLG